VELRPQPGFQERFLSCSADIAIAGGAAGCGKTWSAVYECLRHVAIPDFRAIVFRRTSPQLFGAGSVWEEASNLYPLFGARPYNNRVWRFPSGATVEFGHLQHEATKLDHQSKQYALIIWEEATHFSESQFWYLNSRNRSLSGVRPYQRLTCNPDPDSFIAKLIAWWIDQETGFPIPERSGVVRWFVRDGDDLDWGDSRAEVEARHPDIVAAAQGQAVARSLTFIPGKLDENEILMRKDPGYIAKLLSLPRVERERLLKGNWKIKPAAGMYFQRGYFPIVDEPPGPLIQTVRFWDKAASEPSVRYPDPDWTAGVKMAKLEDTRYLVMHVERTRGTPAKVDALMKAIASQDGTQVPVGIFQDPAQAGKVDVAHTRQILDGYTLRTIRASQDKVTMAGPFSAQAEGSRVLLLRGPWNDPYLNELEPFPDADHDDQVDASSGAYQLLQSSPLGYA
jgi:predicted phage terminase large subunit-like protein